MPDPADLPLTAAVAAHFRNAHALMREVVTGLSPEALDSRLGPDTNSVAVLVMHSLDAERHITADVAGLSLDRDREAAFRVAGMGVDDLLAAIAGVERDVDTHLAGIAEPRLAESIARGQRTATGAWWLLHALAHSREHLGQAALTRQLAEQQTGGG
jgi:hypothetical protein